MARRDFTRPSANAAAACTAGPESASAATSGSTACGSPIRPAASAAWRRTNGSGWRSASRNSAVSYTRVSAAASRRASSSTTPSSRCAAAGLPSASATSDSAIALQAHGIGNRLEQIEDMLRDTREGVLVSEGDERGLARGEQVVRPCPLDRVAEGDAPGRELAHPAANPHQVVVAGGGAVADVDFGDGEVDALLLELLVGQPRLAHQLGAGAIEPDQIVGVVDHAHLVGLGIVDAQGYRADHAGAKSAARREKSNTALAWGSCPPQPPAWSSSPTPISARSRPRSQRRSTASSTPCRISGTRSSSTATCSTSGSSTAR